MAFRTEEPVRSRIAHHGIIEQMNNFNYLRVSMSYDEETNTHNKLNKFLKMTEFTNKKLNVNKKLERNENQSLQHVSRISLHTRIKNMGLKKSR